MTQFGRFRLSDEQKRDVAQNLIDILTSDISITDDTRDFIQCWITRSRNSNRQMFQDVWDAVLKNFMPQTRPTLFRWTPRMSMQNTIVSFSGEFECMQEMGKGKGVVMICNTKRTLEYDELPGKLGSYKYTFYPLVDVLKKAKANGGWGFPESIFDYVGEDEYLMRVYPDLLEHFRWIQR